MNKPIFGTYRGWSQKDNKWIYGYLVGHHIIPKMPTKASNVSCWIAAKYCEPESLGMFTGLWDAFYKPIYSSFLLPDGSMSKGGDIIKSKYNKYKIYYDASTGIFRGADSSRHVELFHLLEPENNTTVLGNAYENPELLEGDNE